jgi:hypothetical protein
MVPVFVQHVQPVYNPPMYHQQMYNQPMYHQPMYHQQMYHQPMYHQPPYDGYYDPSSVLDTDKGSYEPLYEDNLPIDFSILKEDVDTVAKAVPVLKKTEDLHPSPKVEILPIKEVLSVPVKEQEKSTRVKPVIQVVSLKKSDGDKKKSVKKTPKVDKNTLLKDRKEFIDLLVSIATSHSDEINRHPINISKRMSKEDFSKYFKFFFREEENYSFWNKYKTSPPMDEVETSIPFWIAFTCEWPTRACFHMKGLKL